MFTTPLSFAKVMLYVSSAMLALSLMIRVNQLMVFYASLCVILAVELVRHARKA